MDPALNELIGAIYDATIEPGLWHDAIERIRQLYRFQVAMLAVNRLPDMSPLVQVACNVPDWFAEHAGDYTDAIPELWGGLAVIARLPLEEPIVQSQVHDFHQHPDNRWYAEWSRLRASSIRWSSAQTIRRSLPRWGWAHESRPPITTAELDELRMLASGIWRRAATISNLIGAARSEAASCAAFDVIGAAALLVDANPAIRHANRTAEAMLRAAIRSARPPAGWRLVHSPMPAASTTPKRAAAAA